MMTALWVAVGGAVGSVARYGIAGVVNTKAHPWGTVSVNVVGCLVLGFFVGLWAFDVNSPIRIGTAIGLLGGFTTFSTFAVDAIYLWEKGDTNLAVASIFVTVVVGLLAAIAGVAAGRSLSGQ